MSVEIEVSERAPQSCGLHQNVDAHVVGEGVIAGGLDVVEYRGSDIGIDVKRRSSRRPVSRAFFAVNRSPGKSSPRQIEIACASFGCVENRVAPAQGIRGNRGTGVRQYRQDVEFGVPERMAVVSGDGETFGCNCSAFSPCARRDDVEKRKSDALLQFGGAVEFDIGVLPK